MTSGRPRSLPTGHLPYFSQGLSSQPALLVLRLLHHPAQNIKGRLLGPFLPRPPVLPPHLCQRRPPRQLGVIRVVSPSHFALCSRVRRWSEATLWRSAVVGYHFIPGGKVQPSKHKVVKLSTVGLPALSSHQQFRKMSYSHIFRLCAFSVCSPTAS